MSGRFVIGTGRCGSTLLSRLLALHPDVLSISEFFAWLDPDHRFSPDQFTGSELISLLSRSTERQRVMCRASATECSPAVHPADVRDLAHSSPLLLSTLPMLSASPVSLMAEVIRQVERWPTGSLGSHYRDLFEWLCRRLDHVIWVERSAASVVYVGQLERLFPDSRYIHLVRSGPSCARSMSCHPGFRHALGETELYATPAQSDPTPYARLWTAQVLVGLRQLRRLHSDQVFTIWFEDLCSEPATTLSNVAAFFGVAADRDWLEHSLALVEPGRAEQRESTYRGDISLALDRICYPAMRRLDRHIVPPAVR